MSKAFEQPAETANLTALRFHGTRRQQTVGPYGLRQFCQYRCHTVKAAEPPLETQEVERRPCRR